MGVLPTISAEESQDSHPHFTNEWQSLESGPESTSNSLSDLGKSIPHSLPWLSVGKIGEVALKFFQLPKLSVGM